MKNILKKVKIMALNNTFSIRLKQLRKDKNLSIKRLSCLLNISPSTLSRWENNKTDIRAGNIITLAQFFNVKVNFLFGLDI